MPRTVVRGVQHPGEQPPSVAPNRCCYKEMRNQGYQALTFSREAGHLNFNVVAPNLKLLVNKLLKRYRVACSLPVWTPYTKKWPLVPGPKGCQDRPWQEKGGAGKRRCSAPSYSCSLSCLTPNQWLHPTLSHSQGTESAGACPSATSCRSQCWQSRKALMFSDTSASSTWGQQLWSLGIQGQHVNVFPGTGTSPPLMKPHAPTSKAGVQD